jgi:nicotinamidase-related amidase
LLIVDMQEVLIPVVWRGEELAARIAALAQAARDREIPVIALQQTGPPGTPFDPDAPGWQVSRRLGLQPTDLRFPKAATDGFFGTARADRLAARDVDTVVLSGVATDYCVDATARSALSHSLNVVLVSDGHAPVATGDPHAGLTPAQIVDHHNWVLSHAIHPGGWLRLAAAADVFD